MKCFIVILMFFSFELYSQNYKYWEFTLDLKKTIEYSFKQQGMDENNPSYIEAYNLTYSALKKNYKENTITFYSDKTYLGNLGNDPMKKGKWEIKEGKVFLDNTPGILQNGDLILFLREKKIVLYFTNFDNLYVSYRISVESLQIALLKSDRTKWDAAFGKVKIGANVPFVSDSLYIETQGNFPGKPDPYVVIYLLRDGEIIGLKKSAVAKNSFTPILNFIATFSLKKRDIEKYEVKFAVYDKDLKEDDPIGSKTIKFADLIEDKDDKQSKIIDKFDRVRQLKYRFYELE